jgi:subtilisin family serine protease
MTPFEKIAASHFKPVLYEGEPLHTRYEPLEAFLRNNFDRDFHTLLAKPFVSQGMISWYTSLPVNLKPLDAFTASQRKELLLLYHSLLKDIGKRIEQLRDTYDEDNRNWAGLLSLAFDPSTNIIFADGTDIVIVWGWHFNNQDENAIDLQWLTGYLRPSQRIPDPVVADEITDKREHQSEPATEPIVDHDPADIYSPVTKKIIVRSNKKSPGVWGCLSRLWWILLLLTLLIVGLYQLMRSGWCFGDRDEAERAVIVGFDPELQKILPNDPYQRLPIDTSKIIQDEDSVGSIIANRINIALKNKSQSFSQMAIDLKKAYPDSAYQIIYYDTVVSRLQFQFPEAQRDSIKTGIRNKLNTYELLIWDESIFTYSRLTNDPCFSKQDESWHLNVTRVPEAWDITQGDTSVIIAVVDDGFDLNHPDLKNKAVAPYNVIRRNADVFANATMKHGTHVAGLAIANCDNGIGTAGVAPKCAFMPVQISDGGTTFTSSDIIDGILYAIKNHADIINLSLGKELSPVLGNYTPIQQKEIASTTAKDEELFWKELFDYADRSNVTIVIASGNQNLLVGIDAIQRSPNTIKVSATNDQNQKASFSNFGETVTVCAPGQHVYNCAPGNLFAYYDGTSMAAPIVSGIVGLMKSVNPGLKNQQIVQLLQSTGVGGISGNIGVLVQANKAVAAAKSR